MEAVLISIAGSLILILLGIIGYLLTSERASQKETNTKLFDLIDRQREATEKLNISISGLNAVIMVLDQKQETMEKTHNTHVQTCKERFDRLKA